MEPFNCVETMVAIVCKEISFNSFKKEITNKPYTYKSYMYIHLNVCQQITVVKL